MAQLVKLEAQGQLGVLDPVVKVVQQVPVEDLEDLDQLEV